MPNSYAAINPKKFLDANGLAHFAQRLNNYPTNDIITAVVEGVQDALDEKANSDDIGSAGGIASLDQTGKVPTTQLPASVNDVLEYSDYSDFPLAGATGKLYIDATTNGAYRWNGTAYVLVGASAITNAEIDALFA